MADDSKDITLAIVLEHMQGMEERLSKKIDGIGSKLTKRIDGLSKRIDDLDKKLTKQIDDCIALAGRPYSVSGI